MVIEDWVYTKLCSYDRRNPDGVMDYGDEQLLEDIPDTKSLVTPCYCDNCFYGRTKLALYIINLSNQ